jgi:hypothetical protein
MTLPTRCLLLLSGGVLLVLGLAAARSGEAQPTDADDARPSSLIQRENILSGTTSWLLTSVEPIAVNVRDDRYQRQRAIEGYVSQSSIRAGETLTAFVSVNPAAAYRVEIYRLGYYGGKGGRLMKTLGPLTGTPAPEPVEGAKQLMEASWPASFTVPIPRDWLSGVYLAKLTTEGAGYQSYLIWVVRDDRKADLMFQVSDITWQAYNRWPAWRSLYDWRDERWHTTPGARVSFDRPYTFYYNMLPATLVPLTNGSGEFLLWEFPLAFWLEQQGYDVTYTSGIDTHADPDGLLRVRGFLSVGHDEYWTRTMVDNVARARDRGVSLAFLSGNAVDGEITMEPSSRGRPNRIFGRYEGRGTGKRPDGEEEDDMSDEQLLMGSSSYGVGLGDWIVRTPEHWLFEGTGMQAGDRIPGLVGWEYHGPPLRDDPTLQVVAGGKVFNMQRKEQEREFAAVVYDGPRGNVVFNAGTCWWSMVLSSPPGFVNPPDKDFTRDDPRVQRITQNLLARMIGR